MRRSVLAIAIAAAVVVGYFVGRGVGGRDDGRPADPTTAPAEPAPGPAAPDQPTQEALKRIREHKSEIRHLLERVREQGGQGGQP
jgi:hypothetical protein